MHPSLVKARKRLAPLAWLLVLAVLAPAGAHLATGVVLCIGSGHVDIEVAGSSHHEGLSGQATSIGGSLARLTHQTPTFQETNERGDRSCRDVPLRIAGAADACHQVVKNEAPDVEALSLVQAARPLKTDDAADGSHSHSQSAPPLSSQELSHSTVVLLI